MEAEDRELLELAARAAGIDPEYQWSDEYRCLVKNCGFSGDLSDAVYTWAPFQDDRDALRLAVKLGMNCAFIPTRILNSFCEIAADFDDDIGWPNKKCTMQTHTSPRAVPSSELRPRSAGREAYHEQRYFPRVNSSSSR